VGVTDDVEAQPAPRSATKAPFNPFAAAVAVVCAYEVAALLLNNALDDDLLPSAQRSLAGLSARGLSKRHR